MKKLESSIIVEIQGLRAKGFSIPEISRMLNIPKTTVFRYARGVNILPEFQKIWIEKRGGSKRIKKEKEELAFKEAQELIMELTHKEKLLFLCALYWAEGNKKDFILTNSDPDLIKVFINGLREIFGVSNNELKISIRIYEDLDRDSCLSFWSNVAEMPKEKFLSVNILNGKKTGKLPYGMCRVRVSKGGDILKKVKSINKVFVSNIVKTKSL